MNNVNANHQWQCIHAVRDGVDYYLRVVSSVVELELDALSEYIEVIIMYPICGIGLPVNETEYRICEDAEIAIDNILQYDNNNIKVSVVTGGGKRIIGLYCRDSCLLMARVNDAARIIKDYNISFEGHDDPGHFHIESLWRQIEKSRVDRI